MPYSDSDLNVSAIVVTHNSAENIIACLDRLLPEIHACGGEIILIDNVSTDSTVQSVESRFPEVKILQSHRNVGFAAANNIAAEKASAKYLLFANPDMVLDRDSLRMLISEIERRPSAGAVVGRMRNPDGSFQPTCRLFPDRKNIIFSRGSALTGILARDIKRDRYTLGDYEDVTEVPAAAATCMLMEREFFASLGGFDPRFFLYMEDTDLCKSIAEAGKKVLFVPLAGAVHFWGQGSDLSHRSRLWHHHVSFWRYFLKHEPNGFSLFVLPIALAFNFLLQAIASGTARRTSGA